MPLLPQYMEAYMAHVCPLRPKTCIQTMYVPSRRAQLTTLKQFDILTTEHDLRGLEGAVLLSLIDQDQETVQLITQAADIYNSTLQCLRALVRPFQAK